MLSSGEWSAPSTCVLFERTAPTACVVYEQPRTNELPEQSATSAQPDSAAPSASALYRSTV